MQKNTALNGKLLNWFRRFVWLPSKWIFTPVALLCIAYIVWLSRFDIASLWEASDGSLLVMACVVLAVAHFLLPVASREIFHLTGVNVDYRVLLRIHICRLPARYLPRGIWRTVGRAAERGKLGKNRHTESTLSLDYHVRSYDTEARFSYLHSLLFKTYVPISSPASSGRKPHVHFTARSRERRQLYSCHRP